MATPEYAFLVHLVQQMIVVWLFDYLLKTLFKMSHQSSRAH